MVNAKVIPGDLMPILGEIARAAHQVLNPDGGPTKYAFILIVAPANEDPPVQCEIMTNATTPSVRTMLLEAAARIEGRVIDNAGQA